MSGGYVSGGFCPRTSLGINCQKLRGFTTIHETSTNFNKIEVFITRLWSLG